VGSPRLLIRCIHSYPPYVGAICSIRNPRTRHGVVTGTHKRISELPVIVLLSFLRQSAASINNVFNCVILINLTVFDSHGWDRHSRSHQSYDQFGKITPHNLSAHVYYCIVTNQTCGADLTFDAFVDQSGVTSVVDTSVKLSHESNW